MNSDIHIRRAAKKDILTLIQVQKNDGFPHHYYLLPERLERLFDRGELFFWLVWTGTRWVLGQLIARYAHGFIF